MEKKKKEESIEFAVVHPHGAGIDIGSRGIFVSIDGEQVDVFNTFTSGYLACCRYLKENGIVSVAMEATGVYWMSLYEILEEGGIHVCLVHPREVQQVKGRKTDVQDCRWIQKLYAAGLLRESIVAEGLYKEIRMQVRERADLIRMGSTYVNKMQKYLELMNIKLKNVTSQVHGKSGLRVIRAILEGGRDAEKLLSLCHERIREKKTEALSKALEGNYNKQYLNLLEINLRLWEAHQRSVQEVEKLIEDLLDQMCKGLDGMDVDSRACPARHHNPDIEDLHGKQVRLFNGTNLCTIAGINGSTGLRILAEIGPDVRRFPTSKHFTSWLGLSPMNKQSGKMKRRAGASKGNCAGEIFRQAAQALSTSKHNAIGAFIRRLKGRKGAQVAIKAGARKIAIAVYNALAFGMDYVEQGAIRYQEQFAQKERDLLHKLARKYNFNLIENQAAG
ncbi:IS110 family transposase [Bacteroidia bacterium]|nr:IS110 family transposase [Bacteroidia bacterium]